MAHDLHYKDARRGMLNLRGRVKAKQSKPVEKPYIVWRVRHPRLGNLKEKGFATYTMAERHVRKLRARGADMGLTPDLLLESPSHDWRKIGGDGTAFVAEENGKVMALVQKDRGWVGFVNGRKVVEMLSLIATAELTEEFAGTSRAAPPDGLLPF